MRNRKGGSQHLVLRREVAEVDKVGGILLVVDGDLQRQSCLRRRIVDSSDGRAVERRREALEVISGRRGAAKRRAHGRGLAKAAAESVATCEVGASDDDEGAAGGRTGVGIDVGDDWRLPIGKVDLVDCIVLRGGGEAR